MADSRDRDNDIRSPRFSKALLGRVLAVGLFVVLGTFAVATSMNRAGTREKVALETDGAEKTETDEKSLIAKAGAVPVKPPGLQTKPVVQGSFQSNSVPSSLASRFAAKPETTKPKAPTFNTSFTRQAQGVEKPLTSTASSRSAFGSRAKPPAIKSIQTVVTTPKQNDLPSQAKPPTIQGGFDAFKTKVVKTTNDLANKAGEKVRDTASKTNDAVQRSLSKRNFAGSTKPSAVRPPVERNNLTGSLPAAKPASPSAFADSANNQRRPKVSFDTSRNLKPVAKQSGSSDGSASRPLFGGTSFGANNTRPVAMSPVRPQSESNNKPRSFERPIASASSRPAPSSLSTSGSRASATRVVSRTSDAPGGRELEGVQAPALTVEKISPREIQVNREAEFGIVVRNVGRVVAQDIRVFDEVPAGTEFIASVPEAKRSAQRLDWNIGDLRPGQEKRIKLRLKPTRPGEIGSVAHVTFATQATTRTRVTKPVLEIRHSTQPQALIGDPVVFDVIVENKGDGPATNVIVQEDVPKQLEFSDGYRELEYEIGTLMPGQSKRVQLGLKAAQIGRLKNVMFASASGGLRAKHEIDMEVVAPKLVTSTEGATRRFLQRKVEHRFNVENSGTARATNVELIARLPSGLRFVSANNQGRYDRNSHAVYWSLAELQPSIKAGVALETMPVEVGKQDIKFEAFADLNQKSNTTQPLAVEHLVDVFFDIDDVVDPIEIGSDTSYRIKIVNQGSKTATNIELQVDFPNGIQPTGVEGNLRNEIRGQQVLFAPISSMSPGDEISVMVRGKGTAAGDHRVSVNLQADGRQTRVTKQETTRVYADR